MGSEEGKLGSIEEREREGERLRFYIFC